MAGNTRGKIKEEMEGLHRNLDWSSVHAQKIQLLVGDVHPHIVDCFRAMDEQFRQMDELLMGIYATI